MVKRTVTGLILIASFVGALAACYYVDHVILDLYIFLWVALGVYEMSHSFTQSGLNMHKLPVVLMLVAAYPVFYCLERYCNMGAQGLLIVFLCSSAVELAMFTLGNQEKNKLSDLMANLFVLIYPTLFIGAAWLIGYKYSSFFTILFAVFMPLGADTLAYFTGRAIGKRKLCPTISPKKTVEGAIGGIFGSMAVSVIFWALFEYLGLFPNAGYIPFISHDVAGWEWKTALIYLAIGFIGSIVAEIGDLVASRIKRELAIKDYGKIFPGHGGAMDRLDSIISGVLVLLVAFTAIYGF